MESENEAKKKLPQQKLMMCFDNLSNHRDSNAKEKMNDRELLL